MTEFTSTRAASLRVDGATAVIDGTPSDGGLYVPVEFPRMDIAELIGSDYVGRTDKILGAFFDFDAKGVAKAAFEHIDDDPAPVIKLDDNLFVLELWHGGSSSVCDMSLSVLPKLIARAKAHANDRKRTLALMASAGDFGKAALEGFVGVDGTEACLFYPTVGTDAVRRVAVQTQAGNNVFSCGVKGDISAAQAAADKALANGSLRARLAENNITMTRVDEANIGAIVPQIAYYFSAYCDLVASGEIDSGEKIDFVVPVVDFGSICAGLYAVKMGLPVNRLVCASNSNNALAEFIRTGVYDINRELYKTNSPAMDVLATQNLERLIFDTCASAETVTKRMNELEARGMFTVAPEEIDKIREIFAGDSVDDGDTETAVAQAEDEYGYLIDTHTAVAYAVAERREFVRPTVIVSPCNPFMFAPETLRAITGEDVGEASLDVIERLEDACGDYAPFSIKKAFKAQPRFDTAIDPDAAVEFIGAKYCKTE